MIDERRPAAIPIAPLLCLAALIDAICLVVCFNIPLKLVGPELAWVGVLSVAFFLVRVARVEGAGIAGIGAVVVLIFLALGFQAYWPTCSIREAVIGHPDAWSYSAFAKYLWEIGRGSDSGLAVVDEFASHLKNTRFAGAGLLGCLSVLVRLGDPASAMMLFVAVCGLALYLAIFCLARALDLSAPISVSAGILAVAIGWFANAVIIGNLDNLLFLPLFASLLSLLVTVTRNPASLRRLMLPIALTAGAVIYTYPEGAALSGAIALPLFAKTVHAVRRHWKYGLITIALSVAIAGPYLPIAGSFLLNQAQTTGAANRPGAGNFTGLLSPEKGLASFFAGGEEYPIAEDHIWNLLVPALMLVALAAGAWRLRNQNRALLACAAISAVLIAYEESIGYDYAVYKVLIDSSFWFFPVLASGLAFVASSVPRYRTTGLVAATLAIIGFTWVERWEYRNALPWKAGCLAGIDDLPSLRSVAGNRPVAIDVEDPFLQLWAVYYLRDLTVSVPAPQSYLAYPHVRRFLAQAKSGNGPAMEHLHEGRGRRAEWSNGTFSLSREAPAMILSIASVNGVEVVNGSKFLWIGKQPATFAVNVPADGGYSIQAERFIMGPSLPGTSMRQIRVSGDGWTSDRTVDAATTRIPVSLKEGRREVKLSCLDEPTVARQPNGDTRQLLLGLQHFSISAE